VTDEASMLRLDRHLLQHAQQQRVSLIKSSLQAALLAIILLGILLYFTQVLHYPGLRWLAWRRTQNQHGKR
jgi:uncharacterized membrane protein YecN with MAPEG domain